MTPTNSDQDETHSRILVVSNQWPSRGPAGGTMRIDRIAHALANRATIDFFVTSPASPGPNFAPPYASRSYFHQERKVGDSWLFLLTALVTSSTLLRTKILRSACKRALRRFAAGYRYDSIWYIREETWLKTHGAVNAPSIVDVDDLADVIIDRWIDIRMDARGRPLTWFSKRRLLVDRKWLKKIHKHVAKRAGISLLASDNDLAKWPGNNAHVLPNTYEVPSPTESSKKDLSVSKGHANPTILFIGLFVWPPNTDGAEWFVNDVLPKIREVLPSVELNLVGKSSPRLMLLSSEAGVNVVGEVPSVQDWVKSSSLSIAPLRVGGGTRTKILEAFAHGTPVVSTSIGAEGLGVRSGRDILLADSPEEFAKQCLRVLSDEDLRSSLTLHARALVQESFCEEVAIRAIDRVMAQIDHRVDRA